MEFDGKVVVVTGATSGIGRAAAQKFREHGARVAGIGRRREALEEIQQQGIRTFEADLMSEDQAIAVSKNILGEFGGIDILVNAAGVIATGTIESTSLADFDRMMNINVRSVFNLIQRFLPPLVERKGNIVNVSSVNGLRSFAGVLAYNVSKAALDQLTRCAALELAPKGVRVNSVNPGVTVTNLHRRSGMSEEAYGAFLERSKTTHPLGRPGQADEVADLILFLASSRAAWITGDTVSIDGGRALTCLR